MAVNETGASLGVIVGGALHSISGGVVSTTSIVCTQLLEFPLPSVAVQVRVIVSSSGQDPGVTASEKVMVVLKSHISVADAVPVLLGSVDSSHSTVRSAGQVMSGGVVSTMSTVVESVSLLPVLSVTVSVTVHDTD